MYYKHKYSPSLPHRILYALGARSGEHGSRSIRTVVHGSCSQGLGTIVTNPRSPTRALARVQKELVKHDGTVSNDGVVPDPRPPKFEPCPFYSYLLYMEPFDSASVTDDIDRSA